MRKGRWARPRLHSTRPSRQKTPPTRKPNLRSSCGPLFNSLMSWRTMVGVERDSIELELLKPFDVLVERFLIFFLDQEIAQHQVIHVRAHETKIGMFRRADDRFPANIERSIDDHRATVPVGVGPQQPVKNRMIF